MSQHIPATLREQVLSQAGDLCAYCRSASALLGVTFEIDHIVPRSAGGRTTADNLCLSCPTCNRQKGIRQTAPDPASGKETPLFHPLAQTWDDHFAWSADSATVIGLTPVGRATVALLRMNRPVLVQMRHYWVALGLHLPR